MAKVTKKLFGELAIEKGYVTPLQVYECLVEQEKLKAQGVTKTLGSIMHDRELLTLVQVNEIMKEVEGSRRRNSIEGFEIVNKLGKGGMGTVYLARQLSINRLVALKILPPKLARNKEYLTRFMREAQATAKLNHPNIVQAIDVGESNGYHYFVMEYVEGETVKEILQRSGVIEEKRALEITLQTSEALKHAWQSQIIHRDIKPANIMINKSGKVKLCDLGLAIDVKEDSDITKTGVIMGTPYYLSPEQARTEDLDIRSDIYSLGATLYHMATGRRPFEGDSPAEILTKHLSDPLPDPLEQNPTLSNGICYIISHMMSKDKKDRYQNPDELLEDLTQLRDRTFLRGKVYRREQEEERRGIRTRTYFKVTFVVALFAVSAFYFHKKFPGGMREKITGVIAAKNRFLKSLPRIDEKTKSEREKEAEKEKAAKAAYESAERFSGDNPAAFDESIRRYADIVRLFQGTLYALKSKGRIKAIKNRRNHEAKILFLDMKVKGRKWTEKGDYQKALSLLESFPEKYRKTPWAVQAKREAELIRAEAMDRFLALKKKASSIAASRRFADAVHILEKAKQFGLPQIERAVDQEIARLKRLASAQRDSEIRALAEAKRSLYLKLAADTRKAGEQGDIVKALERCETYLKDENYSALRDEITTFAADLKALHTIMAEVSERLRQMVGTEVLIKIDGLPRQGELTEVEENFLYMKIGMGTIGFPSLKIEAADLIRYSTLRPASGRTHRMLGLVYLMRGDPEKSLDEFKMAASAGEDISLYLEILKESSKDS
jgi:serine/threonine-protein kinase